MLWASHRAQVSIKRQLRDAEPDLSYADFAIWSCREALGSCRSYVVPFYYLFLTLTLTTVMVRIL